MVLGTHHFRNIPYVYFFLGRIQIVANRRSESHGIVPPPRTNQTRFQVTLVSVASQTGGGVWDSWNINCRSTSFTPQNLALRTSQISSKGHYCPTCRETIIIPVHCERSTVGAIPTPGIVNVGAFDLGNQWPSDC